MPGKSRNSKYSLGSKEILVDLEVPSGGMCQVKRVGPIELIKAGLFDRLDVLGSLVQTEHVDRVAGRAPEKKSPEALQVQQMQELIKDKSKLLEAEKLIDQVVLHVVKQPELHAVPEQPTEDDQPRNWREPGLVYVDTVDFTDKVFIFQFVVGGSADLESFRQEFQKTLGGLEPSQVVSLPAEPTV